MERREAVADERYERIDSRSPRTESLSHAENHRNFRASDGFCISSALSSAFASGQSPRANRFRTHVQRPQYPSKSPMS